MSNPLNGFDYLEMLEKQRDGAKISRSDFAHYLERKARDAGVPITGKFELTPLCNLSCKMCYVHLMKNQLGDATILTVDQWKDLMNQALQAGMIQCTLTGGECLAYPGFDEIFLYLQDHGCDVCILTNGLLLDEDKIRFFQKHRPRVLQITLYGNNDDVYERVTGQRVFGKVTANIRNLIDADLPVAISVTPNSFLGEDALETLRIAYSFTDKVAINPVLSPPRKETGRTGVGDDVDLDLYVRLYRLEAELKGQKPGEMYDGILPEAGGPCRECVKTGIKCGAGRSNFAITWNGIMTFCSSLERMQCHPLKEGFLNAWKNLNQAARNWPIAQECESCAYRSVCISCAAFENQFAEPGKQPLALCERTKYLVRHGIRSIPVCE